MDRIQLGQPATVKVAANLVRLLAYNNKVCVSLLFLHLSSDMVRNKCTSLSLEHLSVIATKHLLKFGDSFGMGYFFLSNT